MVQAVDVLGQQQVEMAAVLHVCQGHMGLVGLGSTDLAGQGCEPAVEDVRVGVETPDGGHCEWIHYGPEARIGATKVGDTRGRTHASAGQGNYVGRSTDKTGGLPDKVVWHGRSRGGKVTGRITLTDV